MFDKYRVTNCKKLIESSMINESQEKRQPSSPLLRRKTCRKAKKRKKRLQVDIYIRVHLYTFASFTFSKIWF